MSAPPTLVVLAAGVGSRFGGPKQLSPVGPSGETLLDYAIYDAMRAGFTRAVLVVRAEVREPLREHVARVTGGALPVAYVEQRVPEGRGKPWGTAQAVLAARDAVDVPFAVCNADDFYGASGYALLARHLAAEAGTPPLHAFVGYRLDQTLSDHGGVARAVATTGPDGLVRDLVEVRDVRRSDGRLRGVTATGEERAFSGAEPTSMNLWGFTPAIFAALEAQFRDFLAAGTRSPDAEFLLSTALGEQIGGGGGGARLRVLPSPDRWLGMTFAADVPAARAALTALVRAGSYPADLRGAFTRL